MIASSLQNLAFSQGADARLAGTPLADCPYQNNGGFSSLHGYWLRGWQDCHRCWGMLVAGRWRVRPLPPVRE